MGACRLTGGLPLCVRVCVVSVHYLYCFFLDYCFSLAGLGPAFSHYLSPALHIVCVYIEHPLCMICCVSRPCACRPVHTQIGASRGGGLQTHVKGALPCFLCLLDVWPPMLPWAKKVSCETRARGEGSGARVEEEVAPQEFSRRFVYHWMPLLAAEAEEGGIWSAGAHRLQLATEVFVSLFILYVMHHV